MTHAFRYRQSGLTIVELMVALLISSILIAGAISLFLATRKTRTTSQHMNNIATDARFFTTFFAHNIRMAGFTGHCGSIKKPRLKWSPSKKKLTISYCKNGSVDTIKYLFSQRLNKKHNCAGTGGNYVCYADSKNKNGINPLLSGLKFKSISFGKKKSGNLKYTSGKNGAPDFRTISTVRLQFTVLGNSLSNFQLSTGNYAMPTFDFTVSIRNNNL